MKTILVATDFSSTAMNAVKYASDMALSINADLYLVHIHQMPVSYTEIPIITDMEQFQKSAEDELSAVKEKLAGETAGKSIMNFVERNQIDLLIVLPKRYGLLEMIVHKSHTKQFVLHSHVPVLALQA